MSKSRIVIMLSLIICISILTSACGRWKGSADTLEAGQKKISVATGDLETSEAPKDANELEENSETEDEKDTEAAEESDDDDDSVEAFSVYHNPIDQYYLSIIDSWDVSEVEIRAAQDDYRKAWKAEYKHLMKWLQKQCIYEEDRNDLRDLDESVTNQIEVERKVLSIAMTDGYDINPDSSQIKAGFTRMSLPGNGTRSRLNQCEGEIYRDVSMRIIHLHGGEKEYKFQFRETDASKYQTQE